MGLLDDAIREHLELKRQRGADPGEVAREQREALDAPAQVVPIEDAELAAESASAAPLVDPPAPTPPEAPVGELASGGGAEQAEGAPAHSPGQALDTAAAGETAELDMSSVLGDDDEHRVARAAAAAPVQDDSLEWEMPEEASTADSNADEPAEDVLEETPDFLRDTPEQERLWFEQRPPRDFDFDE